jgi:hypothetical protein
MTEWIPQGLPELYDPYATDADLRRGAVVVGLEGGNQYLDVLSRGLVGINELPATTDRELTEHRKNFAVDVNVYGALTAESMIRDKEHVRLPPENILVHFVQRLRASQGLQATVAAADLERGALADLLRQQSRAFSGGGNLQRNAVAAQSVVDLLHAMLAANPQGITLDPTSEQYLHSMGVAYKAAFSLAR